MMSEARVSSSLSTTSSAREVTMVGEAPPEPSGPLVRLSKPSSLCPDPHEVIRTRRPYDHLREEDGLSPDSALPYGTLLPPKWLR
jgi:hypothetical protein